MESVNATGKKQQQKTKNKKYRMIQKDDCVPFRCHTKALSNRPAQRPSDTLNLANDYYWLGSRP